MMKTGNKNILKNKIDLQISSDDNNVEIVNKNLDQLYNTEKLEEVADVRSSHLSSEDDDDKSSYDQSQSRTDNDTQENPDKTTQDEIKDKNDKVKKTDKDKEMLTSEQYTFKNDDSISKMDHHNASAIDHHDKSGYDESQSQGYIDDRSFNTSNNIANQQNAKGQQATTKDNIGQKQEGGYRQSQQEIIKLGEQSTKRVELTDVIGSYLDLSIDDEDVNLDVPVDDQNLQQQIKSGSKNSKQSENYKNGYREMNPKTIEGQEDSTIMVSDTGDITNRNKAQIKQSLQNGIRKNDQTHESQLT